VDDREESDGGGNERLQLTGGCRDKFSAMIVPRQCPLFLDAESYINNIQ
jgi:hypothetical protein